MQNQATENKDSKVIAAKRYLEIIEPECRNPFVSATTAKIAFGVFILVTLNLDAGRYEYTIHDTETGDVEEYMGLSCTGKV